MTGGPALERLAEGGDGAEVGLEGEVATRDEVAVDGEDRAVGVGVEDHAVIRFEVEGEEEKMQKFMSALQKRFGTSRKPCVRSDCKAFSHHT